MADDNTKIINSDAWKDMTYNELLEQKQVMMKRFQTLAKMNKKEIATIILKGIDEIDVLLKSK